MSGIMFKDAISVCIHDLCRIQGYFQFKSESSEIAQKGIKMIDGIIKVLEQLMESGIL